MLLFVFNQFSSSSRVNIVIRL